MGLVGRRSPWVVTLSVVLGLVFTAVYSIGQGPPGATAASGATYFPIAAGFDDVIPHQIVRTNDDRVRVFAAKAEYSSTLVAYWTPNSGLPSGASDFSGTTQVLDGANITSVDAAYDGAQFVHVLVVTQAGHLEDYPFDTSTNTFRPLKTLATGDPFVNGDYIGTSGISGMFDPNGTLHLAYWSANNHITYQAYTYNSGLDSLTLVSGPARVDSGGSANHPALAVSPVDNSVTVAWVSQIAYPYQILTSTRSSGGGWGPILVASTAPVWTSTNFGLNIDQGPSLLISSDGTMRLTYIENYDKSNNYGHVHYVENRGSGWNDVAVAAYSHDPALAVDSGGDLYILGHGSSLNSTCTSNLQICTMKQNADGSWGNPRVFASPSGSDTFDSSPSVKWSVVGFNRPDTIEFLFFDAVGGSYNNTLLYYARLPSSGTTPTATTVPPSPTTTPTVTPTGLPTLTSTPSSSSTATVVGTATPSPTVTSSPTGGGTSFTDTTASDFASCGVGAGLAVTDMAGGELRLAAALEDYYDGPINGSTWTWGTWNNSSFTPSPSNGVLPIADSSGSAWVRSVSSWTQRTLSGQITYSNGAWQHFGWGSDGFGNGYAIVSTYNDGANLYARTSNGGAETRTLLSGVSLNAPHPIQIVWGPATVSYFVDGALAATHVVAVNQAMYVYGSINLLGTLLQENYSRVEWYPTTIGTNVSCVKDAGSVGTWGQLTWQGQTPTGTTVSFQTQTSSDGVTWSPWAPLLGNSITSPDGRYLRYSSVLEGLSTLTPEIDAVTVTFSVAVASPTATPTGTATSTATASPTVTASITPTLTASTTPVVTSTSTATRVRRNTRTPTPTVTVTAGGTVTVTAGGTVTVTASGTVVATT